MYIISLSLAVARFLYTSYIGDLQKTRFSLEMCRENTFYPERTHSIPRKHILYQANTFHPERTHSFPREHILSLENSSKPERTHSIPGEHVHGDLQTMSFWRWCLQMDSGLMKSCVCVCVLEHVLSRENTFYP